MLLKNKKIAIVGGGPSGLTLARLLQLKGADAKVYERDFNKNTRVQGSPLDMHKKSGWLALQKADLLDEFEKNIRIGADKKIIVNERAEIQFSDHETKSNKDANSATARPEIDRGSLRKMLMESLEADTVWNSHFTSLEAQNDGWLLNFKNSPSAYADLVIAADGANSKIRPYITDIKAFYSGILMLEINVYNAEKSIPNIYKLLNGGKVMAFGNSKCFLGGQKGNNYLGFYASFRTDENWLTASGLEYSDNTQLLEWFKTEYCGWDSIWYEIFEKATMPFIPRPIYCMPLNQTWESLSNITMVGDAAHVMPPFAGKGANMAMLDALELSEYLTSDKYHSLQEAISFYETSMRKRAAVAAEQSLKNGERMHSQNALNIMLEMFNGH